MEAVSNLPLFDWVYVFLFFIAIIAGVVDAIAGGGGLITVPSLMLVGLPPMTALGTNRLQAVIGELTTSVMFLSSKECPKQGLWLGLIFTSIDCCWFDRQSVVRNPFASLNGHYCLLFTV